MADDALFWDELLDGVEKGGVIPVVGSDLLRGPGGKSFSQVIAAELASRLGVTEGPADLAAFLTAELRGGRDEVDLFGSLTKAHTAAMEKTPMPEPLRQLAEITDFSLFLSTTTDGLMARALETARGKPPTVGAAQLFDMRDLPPEVAWPPGAVAPPSQAAVYHFLGQIQAEPNFALNDEDVLEFFYRFQDPDKRPKRLYDRLVQSHLLLIGNSFPDWQSRFFLRILRRNRLSDRAATRLAVADECTRGSKDSALILFLKRFSKRTVLFEEGGAAEFVAELHTRWMARRQAAAPKLEEAGRYEAEDMAEGSIFISYSRPDGASAARIHDALFGAKFDVWFDRSRLKGGDPFEEKIRRHIRQCDLFVPIISRHTNTRGEGFVFKEWKWALEREAGIQHGNFIFPLIADDLGVEEMIGVAEEFRRLDCRAAPGGALDDLLLDYFRQNIREIRLRRPRQAA